MMAPEADVRELLRAAGLEPVGEYRGMKRPWHCRCLTCGADVTPIPGNVRRGQGGCIHCGRRATAAARTIPADDAAAAMRAAGLEPLEPYPGRTTPWRCRCKGCGTVVAPRLGGVLGGRGCIHCGRSRAAEKRRADTEAAVALMRAAGLEPLEPYRSGKAPWLCRCLTCGAQVRPARGSIQQGQGGCRQCADTRAAAARRVPADIAVAEMRAVGLEPLADYPGSAKPWRCRCTRCGTEAAPRLAAIRSGQGPCRKCADLRNGAARATDPHTAADTMRAAGLEPLEPYPGNMNTPWQCRCLTCGAQVAPALGGIKNGQGGCTVCGYTARRKTRTGDPVCLYLIEHPAWAAVKIGIGGNRRLAQHARQGWREVRVWLGLDPAAAANAERAVLNAWRTAGIPDALPAADMPHGGHTETAPAHQVDIAAAVSIVARALSQNRDRCD